VSPKVLSLPKFSKLLSVTLHKNYSDCMGSCMNFIPRLRKEMENKDAQRQIQQMVNFILNEAKDKAEEIDAKAMEDFNIEKLKHIQLMKEKLRKEYAVKLKKIETDRAIQRSTAINKSRLRTIEERNRLLMEAVELVKKSLVDSVKKTDSYKKIVIDLIVQGGLLLLEPELTIRSRKEDFALVKSIIDEAQKKYASVIKTQTEGAVKTVKFTLDEANPLEGKIGGVVVQTTNGTIRVDNTLDTRLDLVVEKDKPTIRKLLFPSA
jgi:V-type H+-transporting ATPase subunit E